ncbi:hypothetical protein [Denitrobaculum tricleocarpae]|uniref:Zf-HC2 domain-containing protein n=1 Tax=Denitrobaculum tricleocarpae TaxID=2591009 RepID=A0A545TMM3_9PROT|nr:hypothetical protein [Denitrobaculum tricleocarpae]TQV78483.1 hypothetical protein FKG95_18145 [Denitrobaculum tricleocarpae]
MTDAQEQPNDQELMKLLPFYVNRSLDEDEQASIEDYLARSEAARIELIYLERLRNAVKRQSLVNSPGELGLKRLQKDIAPKGIAGNGSGAACDTLTGKRASDLAGRAQLSARGEGVAFWWRHVAVAACLTLAVFAGLSTQEWQDRDGEPQLAGSASGAVLQVTFKPHATEAAIRSLLLETGLSIKEGPSSLGIYYLDLDASVNGATLKSALQKLRNRADVVDTAEID